MNTDMKNFNKLLANQIKQYIKVSHNMIKLDLYHGYKDFAISGHQSV